MNAKPAWLGSPPPHWQTIRLKYIFREKGSPLKGNLPPGAISFGDVVQKEMLNEDTLDSYQEVHAGDFLVNPINLNYDLKSLRTALSTIDVRVSPAYIVLEPDPGQNPRYLRWLLHQFDVAHMKTLGAGVRQTINFADIGGCEVRLPPRDEQERIANFLDEQTARIDALIAEKEALKSAVQDYFDARLGTAVVEGLNPNRKLVSAKSKGIEAVRSDWRLVPLKHLVSFCGGMTPSKDNDLFWTGEIPWISPKDMKRFILTDSEDHISQLALDSTSLKLQPPGSVLVVVRGMILAHTFPVAINAVAVTINQDMKAMRPKGNISAQYLAWTLRGLQPLMLSLTEESAHGTKVLRTDQWANQAIPLPPRNEQTEMVAQFELWAQQTSELAEHLAQHIERLREYRASLISAAVTGQLDLGDSKTWREERLAA